MTWHEATVECYSGHSYADQPRAFRWAGRRRVVQAVRRRWREPLGPCFQVLADDAKLYLLAYHEAEDRWFMSALTNTIAEEVGQV